LAHGALDVIPKNLAEEAIHNAVGRPRVQSCCQVYRYSTPSQPPAKGVESGSVTWNRNGEEIPWALADS